MRIRFFIAFLLLGQIAVGQTQNHKKIAGTKCSLIPPEGFEVATNFSGFQSAQFGASIMVTEIPAPAQKIMEGFTGEALKTKGMTLIDKQVIDFNRSKATLIKLSQRVNGITYLKQILIFGDTKNTVLINGIYPKENQEIEPVVKNALLSTVYSASQDDNPLEAARFTIDVSGTPFKFIKYFAGSLMYSTDDKIPTESPLLIVANSISKVDMSNKKQSSIDRLKKLPQGELSIIKEIQPITIDDLSGYEIIANGKNKNSKDELIYQVMLFSENGDYFLIVGMTTEDFENNLALFKKITKTFKKK